MATISFSTEFNLSTGGFIFTDTSDYAGQGIALADVNGCFEITSPSNVIIYNNTDFFTVDCDIYIDNSLESQNTINLPLDNAGNVEQGVYSIKYTVYDSNVDDYYIVTNTYDYEYESPTVCITQSVDCISPLFTSRDVTNYTVNSVLPTISRVHTIYFPNGSAGEGSPEVGSTATITLSTFYNGTQTTTIESTLEYTYPDGLIVTDIVNGTKEVVVDCTWMCSIYCCVKALETRMIKYSDTNEVLYKQERDKFNTVMALIGLTKLAVECGKTSDVSIYLNTIKNITECNDDCSCGDNLSLVTGVAGLVNNVVVQSGGSYVTVTASTVGNTTTYTVNLSSTFINLFNNLSTSVNTINNTLAFLLTSITEEEITPFAIVNATDQVLNDITVTVVATGSYMVIFEGDWKESTGAVVCDYRLVKNQGTTPVAITTDRTVVEATGGGVNKMYIHKIPVSLTQGDTVDLVLDSTGVAMVVGRSITLIRIG